MKIELNDLMEQLQGHWKLDNDGQHFEISGNEITVFTDSKPVKTSFQLVRNLQLGNWQIKVLKPMSWLRTFIVALTPDSFVLYDFNLDVQMAMGARNKLLNPNRVYKYTRVAVEATV
jgi:hypothetical protein